MKDINFAVLMLVIVIILFPERLGEIAANVVKGFNTELQENAND